MSAVSVAALWQWSSQRPSSAISAWRWMPSCRCVTWACVSVSQTACFYHLRRLRSVRRRRQLSRGVTARLLSAFVLSRLDYCNVVLASLQSQPQHWQRVLHAAARLVLDLRPRDHASQALRELHWLPMNKRIDYKLCLLVSKASIGQAPTYIIDMLTPVSSVQSLSTQRSATNGDYIVPRTHRKLGERAFSVAAPRAWNRLPTELKTSTCSIDSFKTFSKNHFYFSPPTAVKHVLTDFCNAPSARL